MPGVLHQRRRAASKLFTSGIEVYADYIDFLIGHGRQDEAMNQAELSRARTLAEGLSSRTLHSQLFDLPLTPNLGKLADSYEG